MPHILTMYMYMYILYVFLFFLCALDDLLQVLGKLENSTDVDGSCRLAQHLLDILEAADYRTVQVYIITCNLCLCLYLHINLIL